MTVRRGPKLIGGAQACRACYERAATSLRIVWISRPGGFYRTDSSKFRAIVVAISQGRRDAGAYGSETSQLNHLTRALSSQTSMSHLVSLLEFNHITVKK